MLPICEGVKPQSLPDEAGEGVLLDVDGVVDVVDGGGGNGAGCC